MDTAAATAMFTVGILLILLAVIADSIAVIDRETAREPVDVP